MRRITIHQSDAKNILILDDSDEPIDQYCNRLSELMKMGNVAIIKTSDASVVLRPSKIVGIKVEDCPAVQEEAIIPTKKEEQTTEAQSEVVEDIITDVDE